ncbi:MAG: alpha/beta hydrolase, partial [Pseudoflavonifractor sp.]
SGFPPTLIQAGTNEILLSDSIRLRDRMRTAQVPCKLEVWSDMWHVFQMFPLKKASEAMESIGKFLLEQL